MDWKKAHRAEAERIMGKKKLRVYGWQESGRERWIMAASSQSECARARGRTRPSQLSNLCETGNAEEIATATAKPGTLFTRSLGGMGRNGPWEERKRKDDGVAPPTVKVTKRHRVVRGVACGASRQPLGPDHHDPEGDPMSGCQKPRLQCAKCPWKVDTDPFEIPNGYDPEKHRGLARTIADPGDIGSIGSTIHVFTCHETGGSQAELPCVGWLLNQLGPGNNMALRFRAMTGQIDTNVRTVGEQHERFEDTLP